MEILDLFLLGGTYRSFDEGVVLELFGRDPNGASTVLRYYGFQPYFELVDPTPEEEARLRAEPEFVRLESVTRWLGGQDRPAFKATIRHPWAVPGLRERYRRPGETPNVIACDIPFVHRFLYDKQLGLTVRCEVTAEPPEIRSLYTTERVLRAAPPEGSDIRAAEPFRAPLTYLSFDIENAIRERTIFTICGVVERNGVRLDSFRLQGEEREILTAFFAKIRAADPDVLTGYNIGGYDIPLLLERAQALGLPAPSVGRDGGGFDDAGERLWRIHGRIVADAWWAARKELHPKQETLDYVARTLLNEHKLDVDRRNIAAEWARDPAAVMEYCEHDAWLALRILTRLKSLDKAADMATVAHLPLEEGLNGRTSLFVDALLIPRADRSGVGVPPSRRLQREAPIEGGYVHTIRPGLYAWVVVLDCKAMYPTIIISRNLCFTTLAPDRGPTVSPSGARFLAAEERRGIIPQILEELMRRRDQFRAQSRSAGTPELREYYDGLQYAVKILMNSFYGVLASSFYRFTNKDIGAAITSFAREQITQIIRALEAGGHEVVYSDTDSVFVTSPTPTRDGSVEFGQEMSRRFTAEGVTFEFQSVFESLFSHGAKKRYVGRSVWPREEVVVRGYESRRTDAFDYQVEALNEIFALILRGDIEGTIQRARELVARVLDGNVPPERLVIARSVRAEEEYNAATRENLPFLRVFKILRAEGYDVIPGMKVAWIVTDGTKTPQQVEPWIAGRALEKPPDRQYYAERVAQTLARVTEVYDWDAAALLHGRRQQRLQEPDGEAPRETPPTVPSPVAIGLDTPFGATRPAPRHRRSTLQEYDAPAAGNP
ncbi:MAG: DNA-directed DNA polymerase [Thermoplasmata archaeon]